MSFMILIIIIIIIIIVIIIIIIIIINVGPDGLMLIPWQTGRAVIWDATVTDTLAASYLPSTSVVAAATAEQAADRKCAKYDFLSKTYHFVPLACETLGPINNSGHLFFTELGCCLSRLT